jgi:Dyp-type peroxidase family
MKNPSIDIDDIQGIIISGYGDLFFTSILFLEITHVVGAKQWLSKLIGSITTANHHKHSKGTDGKPRFAIHLALTMAGLKALGLPQESLDTFPPEFKEGMNEPSRSRRLGDNGESSPIKWDIGGINNDGTLKEAIHILVMLQTAAENELSDLRSKLKIGSADSGLRLIKIEEGHRFPDQKEHFGFRDGVSEPNIEGSPKDASDDNPAIQTGEFILGYPNSYGHLPPSPSVSRLLDVDGDLLPLLPAGGRGDGFCDLGRNGSFLVLRKLHQDVAAFRMYFQKQFGEPDVVNLMMAKVVGRWPSGAPLALTPKQDDLSLSNLPQSNNFGYANDTHGFGCPIGAHVRRSNPRDALGENPEESLTNVNRHRIIRRGASYGEPLPAGQTTDDGKARGLLFFCINADIKRQFEFLQQTWINNPKFGGLYNDPDPLVGDNREPNDKPRECNFTVPQRPIRARLKGLPRFVTVKGGCYFFLPGLAALKFLATGCPVPG